MELTESTILTVTVFITTEWKSESVKEEINKEQVCEDSDAKFLLFSPYEIRTHIALLACQRVSC